jgi:hypothetical protein
MKLYRKQKSIGKQKRQTACFKLAKFKKISKWFISTVTVALWRKKEDRLWVSLLRANGEKHV